MIFNHSKLVLFEYDSQKSRINETKHGINFDDAQVLWNDVNLLVVPVQTEPELRYVAIGKIGAKHWSAIFTQRADRVRLISVRRARKKEIFYYENDQHNGF